MVMQHLDLKTLVFYYTSCWIQILKLQTLGHLWFVPSHYSKFVDNYNKENVIATNKITPTTGLTETIK